MIYSVKKTLMNINQSVLFERTGTYIEKKKQFLSFEFIAFFSTQSLSILSYN